MPPQEQDGHSPDVPFTRLASASFKVVSSIAAIVAAISTIYVSLFSPNKDLLQFLGFSAATLATVALGLAAFVVRLKARSSGVLGDKVASQPAFTQEERAAARNRLVPLGLALVACSIALFTTDHFLMPKILEIGLSDTDSEVLIIKGSRFGKDVSRVWVRFSGVTTEEQVARKADANVIEVVVPSKFSKGTISVRRGPRVSGAVSFTFPGVIYETAVVRLIQQSEDPIQRLMAQFDPDPAFPYYSDISDKPTQWPPRVFKDQSDFHAKIRQALSGAAAQEVAGWESRTPPKLTFLGGSPDDPQLKLFQSYARLRMLLTYNNGDYRRVSAIVGPHAAQALRTLEDARRALATNLPNRAFILRVRNQSPEDAENFTVELKVGGYVYDVTVNEEGEKAHSLQWSPDRINIDLPRLRPGYTTDIKVWYAYLPLSERVFPDAADVEWEMTQGIVVHNLGVSNGLIRRSSRLLRDLHPYHRYAVDPVQGSPTFGSLPEPSSEAALPVQHPRTEPVPSSSVTNEPDKQTQESVPPAQPPKSR
jgi:hypothetical protein